MNKSIMIWDEKVAQDYVSWENSETGQFVLARKKSLLLSICAPWLTRKASVLEVGCGTGYFLQVLQEAGLDVTGVDFSPPMLNRARGRVGSRADLHLGNAEYLQFETNGYDYVLLLNVLEFCRNPGDALEEAFRIAKKGVLVNFLNRHSCYYLARRLGGHPRCSLDILYAKAHYWSWPEMRRFLNLKIGQYPIKFGSVLPGPPCTWKDKTFCRSLNSRIYPLPWGAQCVARLTFCRKIPLTPIFAWKREPQLHYPKTNTLTSDCLDIPSCPAGIRIRPSAWSMVFNNPDFPIKGTAVGKPSSENSRRTRT